MLMKRTAYWLLAWGAFVLLAADTWAQVPANSNLDYQTSEPSYENGNAPFSEAAPQFGSDFLPFHPTDIEPDGEPFAPAETSDYGNGPRPHVGWFSSYERVFWAISKPSRADIGSASAEGPAIPNPLFPQLVTTLVNSANTGFLTANGRVG